MKYYFAPMEGITDSIYRRLHRRYFSGVDRYYTPFISPTQNHCFSPRALRDVLPENNRGVPVIPQLLTKNGEDFLWAAGELAGMGYQEVNLNLGCPSGTVTAKGKGAGALAQPERLEKFLEEIFSKSPVRISVKTRLGMEEPSEFRRILAIYGQFPICELIIHPRTRADMYRGPVDREAFAAALASSRAPVCYNGDLFTLRDCRALAVRFPGLPAAMLGRGLAADPAMAAKLLGRGTDKETLRRFHESLCLAYQEAFGGQGSALPRMKAIWSYMLRSFQNGEQWERKLLKAKRWPDFQLAVSQVFESQELKEEAPDGGEG